MTNQTYDAGLQDIASWSTQVERDKALLLNAQAQFVRQVAADYHAGHLTVQGVYEVFLQAKAIAPSGFCALWDEVMPRELEFRRIRYTAVLHAPDEDGNWRGAHPFAEDDRTPPTGVSVVYVLFDDQNEPCYVGSTAQFRQRISAHSRDKEFVRWMACPCADRESAYALEDRLLRGRKPYLNGRASR